MKQEGERIGIIVILAVVLKTIPQSLVAHDFQYQFTGDILLPQLLDSE